MVKEKGNEKGKGDGKENAKAKTKEKSVNYLIRQDSALPPPVPRKKRKPKVQIKKAKDFPNAPTGELICAIFRVKISLWMSKKQRKCCPNLVILAVQI